MAKLNGLDTESFVKYAVEQGIEDFDINGEKLLTVRGIGFEGELGVFLLPKGMNPDSNEIYQYIVARVKVTMESAKDKE